MLARFFIDRPVLAWVMSIIIILLGAIAAGALPIAEYPEVTPPTVRVQATYPRASAQVVADTVAAPIEQQVVGVENMLYMSSQSSNDGSYTLDVAFALGTDVNMAQVLVQNRVAIALPTLPDVVKSVGVTTKKRSPDILMVINLHSDDNPETGRPYYDQLYMSNYATIRVTDVIAGVEGVGDVFNFGQLDSSMRVWLDPDKLQARGLTVADVIRVLREQNVQVAAGQDGDQGKEALPWWFFGLVGGLATVWLLTPVLGPRVGLSVGGEPGASATGEATRGLKASLLTWAADLALFLSGAVAGGALGWFLIRPVNWALGRFFRAFNGCFSLATEAYGKTVGWCLRLGAIVLVVCVGLLGLTSFGMARIPSGFIPILDKGYLIVNIQLPDSASQERTVEVTAKVEQIALQTPGVAHTVSIPGQSFVLNANSSNYGSLFIPLKPFHERKGAEELSGEAILKRLRARLAREVPEARVLVFGPPAVRGLGNAGGFKLMVKATGDADYGALQAQADNLAAKGNQQPGLVGLFNGFRARRPQLYADVDREKVKTMEVPLSDVFDALQAYLGSYYVNDFNRFGRTWQVNIQAEPRFRTDAEAVRQLKVRNAEGDMVPLAAVAEVRNFAGPVQITRYNMFPAAPVTGASLPDVSTGDVLATMERLADQELPKNMTSEWTELSYLQKQASKVEEFRDLRQNPLSAFVLGAVLVFFVLAGLYEGWSLPLAVILVVPMCVLCALAGVFVRGLDNSLFTQIGFVVLIGLACKNAILIVEFARDRQLEGARVFDAAVEAARVRLRPIVMTTFCFIHMVPPYFASGTGAEMRRSVGMAMLWGAFGVTLFGIFLTPVFFYVIRTLVRRAARNLSGRQDDCRVAPTSSPGGL